MKKLAVCAAVLSLAACGGGYDDMDAARPGGGISNTPSTPVAPGTKSLWDYSQVNTSKFAKMKSLNTIPTDNIYNDAIMQVTIHNYRDLDGVTKEYLTIMVLFADTACDVSCQVRYKKNGSLSDVYTVRESSEGVIDENSFVSGDMEKLIKAIKNSSTASITLPLDGMKDAEFFFNFAGYNNTIMKFSE